MIGIKILEELAIENARKAVELDMKGAFHFALEKYNRVIDILQKLITLSPKEIYFEMLKSYQKRVLELKSGISTLPIIKAEHPRELMMHEKPDISLNDVVDLEDAKKAIIEAIVYPVKKPELFVLGWPTGILLYGPPGCGKTLLAAAVANEINAEFIHVTASSLISKYLGETERNVAMLFDEAESIAERGKPVILFIDEVDALFTAREDEVGGEARLRSTFLEKMDGLESKSKKRFLYVLAATNKPWLLDYAFIRRFQKRIYCPAPSYNVRVELFKHFTKHLNLSEDVNIEELARITEGYAGSDIRDICQQAYMEALREYFESGEKAPLRKVTMEDFKKAINNRKPSIPESLTWHYRKWTEQFKAL